MSNANREQYVRCNPRYQSAGPTITYGFIATRNDFDDDFDDFDVPRHHRHCNRPYRGRQDAHWAREEKARYAGYDRYRHENARDRARTERHREEQAALEARSAGNNADAERHRYQLEAAKCTPPG